MVSVGQNRYLSGFKYCEFKSDKKLIWYLTRKNNPTFIPLKSYFLLKFDKNWPNRLKLIKMIKKIILEFLNSKFLENNTFWKIIEYYCRFVFLDFRRKTEYLTNQKDQMGFKRFPARVNPTKSSQMSIIFEVREKSLW